MRNKFRLAILFVSYLLALPVFGDETKTFTYSVLGASVLECNEWIKVREAARLERKMSKLPLDSILAEIWILGYMSGYTSGALAEDDPLTGVNGILIYDWLDKYCIANKKKRVTDGAQKLLGELVLLRAKKMKRAQPKSVESKPTSTLEKLDF